ncbi:Type 4 prepilin-like proteins leader peptide-processing enzyme [Candidatus Magnetaquicoccaceae bacterium FCR-1]|uniref:Prepilin leader peptidase/N-methyltransferase n=1 Tax=Candidatus Magnetaquiglobus chichijimensis TaxID=3141448 RepID=A0ABQ0CC24_9PROT
MSWHLLAIFAFAGLIFGSFLNVLIHRIPLEENIVFPRSRCPHCRQMIAWHDNIPVLSWLILLARCRHCRARISIQYPLVELTAAILTAATLHRFGLTPTGIALTVLGYALITLTVIDLYHYILPDVITLPGIAVGIVLSLTPWFVPPLANWQESLIGLAAGGGGLWLFGWIFYKLTGKEGMGLGDVKLVALFGAWLGWQALPLIIFGSAVIGSVVGITWILVWGRDRSLPIPFGPYLALAAWGYLHFGPAIYAWYLGRMVMLF